MQPALLDPPGVEADLARIESYLSEGQRLSHTGSYAWILASGEFWPDERFRISGLDPTVKPTLGLMLERIHPDDRAAVRQRADEAAPY
jgi:hypothetical protein